MKLLTNIFILIILSGFWGCGSAKSSADRKENDKTPAAVTESQPPQEAMVKMVTDYGVITIKLYNETPLHRDNFIKLVKQGYYDSLLFHRVIKNFMIQGGDPESRNAKPGKPLGNGGPGYKIPAEIRPDLIHKKGALAAAREADFVNPEKASSGSQFYIVQGMVYPLEDLNAAEQRNGITLTPKQKEAYSTIGGTPHLDNGYTVFGEVVDGLAVVDAIAAVATAPGDRPLKDVRMTMVLIRDYSPAK